MGGIAGILGDPISAITGGLVNLAGDSIENQWANNSAQHQMDFQESTLQQQHQWYEEDRANQYQVATDSMKAAGLNPMLAYSQGGAPVQQGATASGASASVPHSGLMDAVASASQISLIQSQARKNNADAAVTEDELTPDTKGGYGEQPKAVSNRLKQYQATEAWNRAQYIIRQADLTESERHYVDQKIINAATENRLNELDIPRAVNEAKAQSSWYMQNVAPYTGEAAKWSSAASGMRGRSAPTINKGPTNIFNGRGTGLTPRYNLQY